MVTEDQLQERWSSNSSTRTGPLGEILVRMGRSRATTCRPRSAARWATRSSTSTLPGRARGPLRKLNYGVAARLREMPLLIRDGRLDGRPRRPVAPRRAC
jgi:hypothetical protein